MEDIRLQKKTLRKKILDIRNQLNVDDIKKSGSELKSLICQLPRFINSENILLYASFGTEIDTWELIEYCLLMKKNVFLPKIEGKEMSFYKINSTKELQPGKMNILEPPSSENNNGCNRYEYDESTAEDTFILVPGVAFEKSGARLGYGGGYYDRFFADKKVLLQNAYSAYFDFMIVDIVPIDKYDICVGNLIGISI